MAKGSAGRTQRAANPSSGRKDSDGRRVWNFILSTLPEKEWAQIDSSLEFVRLRLHQVLHETGETIKSGYFLNDGLGSVLTTEPNGKTVEVNCRLKWHKWEIMRFSNDLLLRSKRPSHFSA